MRGVGRYFENPRPLPKESALSQPTIASYPAEEYTHHAATFLGSIHNTSARPSL